MMMMSVQPFNTFRRVSVETPTIPPGWCLYCFSYYYSAAAAAAAVYLKAEKRKIISL